MRITTRTTGIDVVVEADGEEIQAFDHIEGLVHEAELKAKAYADGVQRGLDLARSQSGTSSKSATAF